MNHLINKLQQQFDMKNLGHVHKFLAISIERKAESFFLYQTQYATSILNTAGMLLCKPLANPTCTKPPVRIPEDLLLVDPQLYRKIIGSLQYITLKRSDLAYLVNNSCQHMQSILAYPLQRLLRYLKGTIQFGIPITKGNLQLNSYSDADWVRNPSTRKSMSGYCTFL
ncbi:uncharacterized protein LOC110116348, partial [Dendrobium catenatum]|uniref:uncharacterized protein LOC110116348 n=1 Tax=Dendrobium catenatum TaxID=906689 RepID=UPI0009F7173C